MLFHQPLNSRGSYNYNASIYTEEEFSFHFHKNPELIYVLRGNVRCTVSSRTETLQPGDFCLCLPYEVHSIGVDDDAVYWVGVFSDDHVRTFAREIDGKEPDGVAFRCDPATEYFLRENLITEQTPPLYLRKACLYAACDAFCAHMTLTEKNGQQHRAIVAITDFIAENHTKNIGLGDIAHLMGYDYHYVSRYFHRTFNMSFKEFLNLYRLETAVSLLEETDKKVTEVALESGFQSVRSFNSCFKTRYGQTPSEYQRAARK